MIALLDCDGVLADFTGHLLGTLGLHMVPDRWDIFGQIGETFGYTIDPSPEEVCDDPHFWRTMPTIEGAQEGVAKIKAAGHEIIVASSPWVGRDEWIRVRKNWLHKHFDLDTKFIACPSHLKQHVAADVFIDDHVETVVSWANRRCREYSYRFIPCLYSQTHNQSVRVEDLDCHGDVRRFAWADVDSIL